MPDVTGYGPSGNRRASRRPAVTEKLVEIANSREQILQEHLPLVRRVVQRLAVRKPPHIELDDLTSWGVVGLLDAIAKYDPGKEAMFSTYAQFRIRGAILDHLRSLDWVPRSVRQKAGLIEKVTHQLEGRFGRPPTEEEIAEEMGLSIAEYQDLLTKVGEMSLFSLEDLGFGTGEERFSQEIDPEEDEADPLRSLLSHERVSLVAEAISRLPEREQLVVNLYYHEELTMKEVGTVLKLTESRVSQLHSQAMVRLKVFLQQRLGSATDEVPE